MSALKPLASLLNIDTRQFSKEELYIIELSLFARLYRELKQMIKDSNQAYFNLINLSMMEEAAMIEASVMQHITHDILKTQEYTLQGIAYYTNTTQDVIMDIATGKNSNPSLCLAERLIELHSSIRKDLYATIMRKILKD